MTTPRRIRLKLAGTVGPDHVLDDLRRRHAVIVAGSAVRIEAGVFERENVRRPLDISGFVSLNLEIYGDRTQKQLLLPAKSIDAASLESITADGWDEELEQNAVFEFTGAETNVAFGKRNATRDAWLVVYGVLESGDRYPCGAGKILLERDNAGGGTEPGPNPELYPTLAQYIELRDQSLAAVLEVQESVEAAASSAAAAVEASAKAVRHDMTQDLTRVQRARARANVGLASAVCVSSVLPSTFTPASLDLSVSSVPVSASIWQDYRARIQDLIDSATASGLKIIWDARVPVAGLILRSGTFIDALPGCGAIVPNNANLPIFSNEHYAALRQQADPQNPDWNTLPRTRGITIDGGIWHGNGQNQIHSNLTEGWTVPFRLFNVEDLTLKNLTIYKPRTFAAQFFNWFNVVFEDIYIDVGVVVGYNFDGLHFNSGERLRGRGLMVKSMDDALAFNADEPWTQSDGVPAFFQSNLLCPGPIRDVQVRDVMLMDAGYGMRILSGGSRVDNITIDGVSGRHGQHLLCIDNYDEVPQGGTGVRKEGPGNIGTITLRNVNTTWIGTGGYKNALVYVGASMDRLVIDSYERHPDINPFNLPLVHIRRRDWKVEQELPVKIGEIIVNGYKARLSHAGTNGVYYHIYNDGADIDRIECNDPTIINTNPEAGIIAAGGLVHSINNGRIGLVEINNPSTNYLATWTRVATGGVIERTVVKNPRETLWREGGTIGDTGIKDDPSEPGVFTLSVPDGMTYTDALGGPTYMFSPSQAIGGEFNIKSWGAFYLHVRQPGLTLRSGTTTPTRQGYSFRLNGTSVALTVYTVSGGSATLDQVTGLTLDIAETWLPELEANGNLIRGYLQRKSDGQWLNHSGAWQPTRVACVSAYDNRMPAGQPMIAIQGAGNSVRCRNVWTHNLLATDYAPDPGDEPEVDDLSEPILQFEISDPAKVLTAADAPAGYWDEVAKLLDTSGNDNHATAAIGYRPRYLAHDGEDYILLPGTAGNSVSLPYFPELHVGGDLTIEAKISIANKTAGTQVIMERWQNSGAILLADCWHLQITSAGLLRFLASPTGNVGVGTTNVTSTAPWPFANHAPGWLRVTYDVDNGAGSREVKFWTSEDGETWDQLGDTLTVAGTGSIIDAPSVLRIGHSSDTGAASALAGRLFRARVRSGLGDASAVIVDIDPAACQDGSNTFPDAGPHGVEVTINRGTASTRATVIKSGMLLFDGVDDHFTLTSPVTLGGSVTYLARQQPFGSLFVGFGTAGTNAAFSPFHQSNSLHFSDAGNAWSVLSHAVNATVRYVARTGPAGAGKLFANAQEVSGLMHSVVGNETDKRLSYIGRRGANYAHGILGDIAVHPKLSDAGMAAGDEWLADT